MREYRLRGAIPTESEARGLHYDGDLFFSAHTHLFRCSQGAYSKVCDVDGTVVDFAVGERTFVATQERMYMNSESVTVGTLRRSFSCIAARNGLIAAGCRNVLEIWHIPTEYRFTLFKLHSKNLGHFLDITSVRFVADHLVLTTGRDCSVRMFNILDKTSRRICSTMSAPLAAYSTDQDNTEITVVCEDGALLTYLLNDSGVVSQGKTFLDSRILASSCHAGFVAVSVECEGENLFVFRGQERVYSANIGHRITELVLAGESIAVRGPGFVGIYNLLMNVFGFELELPRIVCMHAARELVAVGCADKRVRIYHEHRCLQTLHDANSTHPVFSVHLLQNSVLCLSVDGRVSVWDLKNGTCYRSFKIPVRMSASEVSSDGLLLFIADFNEYTVRVVDLQRSKEIDVLTGHSGPIFRMVCSQNALFSLSYDNTITRWNVYSQTSDVLQLEKTITGLAVRNRKLCVATENELIVYDDQFVYERSIQVSLRARKRNELFVSEKPVEHLDFTFDCRFVVAGGESNTLKIVSVETGDVEHAVAVSLNREWENYEERLGRQSDRLFDKTKTIEVLRIQHSSSQRLFYVLTREGVAVYELSTTRFSPISLDVSLTPDAISQYIADQEHLKAAIGSLRINQYDVIKNTVLCCPPSKIEGVVRHLDVHLVESLRGAVSKMLDDPACHLAAIQWLRFVVQYFGSSDAQRSEIHRLRKSIGSVLRLGKLNRLMLLNIARK